MKRSFGLCSSKLYKDVIHGKTRLICKGDRGSHQSFHSTDSFQDSGVLSPRLSGKSNHDNGFKTGSKKQDSVLPLGISTSRSALRTHSHSATTFCTSCGEDFHEDETLDQHYAIHHTVSELKDGDSARNIVEIIFQTSWLNNVPYGKIERIMKVHNSPKAIALFEAYRGIVKEKASTHSTKHPRCLADGNEVLRFYCTTVSCSLRMSSSSPLCCTSESCSLCRILTIGFHPNGQLGVYTTASSGKAHDSALSVSENPTAVKETRAMLLCRVIAGLVKQMSLEDSQDTSFHVNGYDSVAGVAGPYANLEDLFVFNPKAVLPCFVVIYS